MAGKPLPPVAVLVFFLLFGDVFLFGGAYVLYQQRSGTLTQATITSCTRGRRSRVCRGTWALDGRVYSGDIEGAASSHPGDSIEVSASGESAYATGLRLPIILFALGLAITGLAVRWWFVEGRLARRASA